MQKKIIAFIGVVVLLFAGLFFVIEYKNNETVENSGNPYGDKQLEQSTIDQLDDPNYGNQILPDELSETIESGEPVTVYFYSPECVYCQNTTPYLVPLAEDNNVDMKKMNVLEFSDQMAQYGIESTPTLVHYKDGEEQGRIVGQRPEGEFQQFFDQYVVAE
ncbi:thioredoxin family protein [Oceanobacillus kapialis]|uniref:Thioredoxin family protein n=1 Tax=Oceanobacillus kapialis TaxID=481353 RepID=A0ABW5Q4G0_9BACI